MGVQGAMGAAAGAERRRSERLPLNVPLVVSGESTDSTLFQETTFSISVNAHGTLLVMSTKLELGQTLFLKNQLTQTEMRGRVVRLCSTYGKLTCVGVEFTRPAPEFWPLESLPESWKSVRG